MPDHSQTMIHPKDSPENKARCGDLIQLIDPRGNKHILQLASSGKFQTNHGQIPFEELDGLPWGSRVRTHLGKQFLLVQPSLNDLLINTRRATTIMYPKDIGFLLVNMNIAAGQRIIEAGTGSGALTTALCWAVGPEGHIYSYDVRENVQVLARKNLAVLGFEGRVTFHLQDIVYGFEESGVDALFLDVPNPEDYLQVAWDALRTGGFFGSLVPTTNQVSRLLESLKHHDYAFIEVCEILLRYYKPVPARLRPDDRLTAHTGYLVFARPTLAENQVAEDQA
jgi:tRNA (adenine57-N1/adenine58-N1)-methyltransferase